MSASKKEKQINQFTNNNFPLLSKIKNLNNNSNNSNQYSLPKITPPSFDNLSIKISVGILFLILLFISPDSNIRLLLSISTLILTYTQIKSGKRFIGSLGWSVTFLSIGLIFGGFLETNSFIQEVSNNSLSIQKIQSIPAMIILWLGVIFLWLIFYYRFNFFIIYKIFILTKFTNQFCFAIFFEDVLQLDIIKHPHCI